MSSGHIIDQDGKFIFVIDGEFSALRMSADGVLGVLDGNPQIVFDNANNWLEITGDVGIGTASPGSALHLDGSDDPLTFTMGTDGAVNTQVILRSSSAGNHCRYLSQGHLVNFEAVGTSPLPHLRIGSQGYMTFSTATADAMRIQATGRVGIGTTTPGTKLQLEVGSDDLYLTMNADTANLKEVGIILEKQDTLKWVFGLNGANSDSFNIAEGVAFADPRLTIAAGGNVGIGATTFGASMVGGMAFALGTDPTGNVANQFAFWGKDIAAGNTGPAFRTEDGTVIQLDQSLLTTDNVIHNRLALTGGFKANLVTKTEAYTTTADDYTILCDASGGSFTITLIALASHLEGIYHIKKIDSSANTVTLDGNGGEMIEGATTLVLTVEGESVTIQAGSEWGIL